MNADVTNQARLDARCTRSGQRASRREERSEAVCSLLLPERGDEREEYEASTDPDQQPGAEVAQQDAEPNANEDPADECRTPIRVAAPGRRGLIHRVGQRAVLLCRA